MLVGVGLLVWSNWDPDPVFESVEAPRYDATLAGGGLSSEELGSEALLGSLESTEPQGYEILVDAADESVIDEFEQVKAAGHWDAQYRMNDGDLILRFEADNDSFRLANVPSAKADAEELFAVARRYGFYDSSVRDELTGLDQRSGDLLDAFADREFFVGESEPDLAAEASSLIADWNDWVENYGEYPPEARLAQAQIEVLSEIETIASSGTKGFGGYNAALKRYNDALDAYEDETQ